MPGITTASGSFTSKAIDHLRFFQESGHNEELRQQAKRDRLAHEQDAHRRDKVARLREEREAFRRLGGERIRLEKDDLLKNKEMLKLSSMLPYV